MLYEVLLALHDTNPDTPWHVTLRSEDEAEVTPDMLWIGGRAYEPWLAEDGIQLRTPYGALMYLRSGVEQKLADPQTNEGIVPS